MATQTQRLGVRPDIDLPHALHGHVKDYAEAQDITVTEAYEQLLRDALEAEGRL